MPPAARPISSAPPGVTKPDAGVIATSPATAPAAAPETLTFLVRRYEAPTQVRVAAAAAVFVTMNALAARPPAVSAEPALKPNQPNHRRPAPRTVIGMSCGSIRSPLMTRRPISRATIRADRPDDAWTTVPPAKSSAPSLYSQPSDAQTQWAIGEYTRIDQRIVNSTNEAKRLRSAKAPVISAGVIAANISWKAANRTKGIVVA